MYVPQRGSSSSSSGEDRGKENKNEVIEAHELVGGHNNTCIKQRLMPVYHYCTDGVQFAGGTQNNLTATMSNQGGGGRHGRA